MSERVAAGALVGGRRPARAEDRTVKTKVEVRGQRRLRRWVGAAGMQRVDLVIAQNHELPVRRESVVFARRDHVGVAVVVKVTEGQRRGLKPTRGAEEILDATRVETEALVVGNRLR